MLKQFFLALGLGAAVAQAAAVSFLSSNDPRHLQQESTVMTQPELMQLMAAGAMQELVECAQSSANDQTAGETNVKVIVAISKCFSNDAKALAAIDAWVKKVQDDVAKMYFESNRKATVTFEPRVIPDSCQELTEREKKGLNPVLLSEDVQPHDIERIASMTSIGRALTAMDDPALQDPAKTGATTDEHVYGVISFVNQERSYREVTSYESTLSISNTLNFRLCKDGENCDGDYENCITLNDYVSLFMYNAFTVSREFECESVMSGATAVTAITGGERKCYCMCPVGKAEKDGKCETVTEETCDCTWKKKDPAGYKIELTEGAAVCSFSSVSGKGVDVPFPWDNYVADGRINNKDGTPLLSDGPHIDLKVRNVVSPLVDATKLDGLKPSNSPSTLTALEAAYTKAMVDSARDAGVVAGKTSHSADAFPWKEYQENSVAKINALTFTSPGRYELELKANDYTKDAQCIGCLAIVDKYRPKPETPCPTPFCDKTISESKCQGIDERTAEMTPPNIERADALVQGVYDYISKASNDGCGNNRCDHKEYSIKDFFENSYDSECHFDEGAQCFKKENLQEDFFDHSKAKRNPFDKPSKLQSNEPAETGECQRCCKYKVALKEWWTDFSCGKDYDAKYCSGNDNAKCDAQQCLIIHPDTLAKPTAQIKDAVKQESQNVIDKLVQQGFQVDTQVHRSLSCTSFVGCSGFTSSIYDLLEKNVAAGAFPPPAGTDINDYVFWRYKINTPGAVWHEWKPASDAYTATFTQASTKILLQAWSNCGLVREFNFYVRLHLNTEYKVCQKLDDMFYQTTVSRLKIGSDLELCAHPKSDFAELTFDYHPNIGLMYSREKLAVSVTGVQCTLEFAGRSQKATLVDVTAAAGQFPEIVERFAIELINKDTTQPVTEFKVSCTFTYKDHAEKVDSQSCSKTFKIKDCTGPKIDSPGAKCQYPLCAGSSSAGPYEACGGHIVSSDSLGASMSDAGRTCCKDCDNNPMQCSALIGLPDATKDIKYCVPTASEGAYGVKLLEAASAFVGDRDRAVLMAVVGGTGLVALVALVVVKRRNAPAKQAAFVEDAYYPLLH